MNTFNRILFYALAIVGTFYLCRSIVYGEEYHFDHRYEICRAVKKDKPPRSKAELHEAIRFHLENGERTYNDAKNACWYLPNTTDRHKAREAFTTMIALVGPNDPRSKLVVGVISALSQYSLDCIDEWNYIQEKLRWAQYHFELAESYRYALERL